MFYDKRNKQTAIMPMQKRNSGAPMRTRSGEDESVFKKTLFSSLFGLSINVLSGIVLISVVCAVAYSSPDPLSLITPLSLLSLLPSNFLGGFAAAKKCGEAAGVCGCMTGAMWGVISLIAALCTLSVEPSGYSLFQGILLHGASFAFCFLGALAGGIKRNPSRKKRRFG